MTALELKKFLDEYSNSELRNLYVKVRINDSYYNGVDVSIASAEIDLNNEDLVFET